MATFTTTVNAFENLPPSQVGDGAATINYNELKVYTRAELTTLLTPAYLDPEGDPAGLLKVTVLPSAGKLKLNGVDVVANQIIDFADIDAGLFTYTPDSGTLTAYDDPFEFQIADTGSGIFVG